MPDYEDEYSMSAILTEDLTDTDLINELGAREPGETVEAYRVRFAGERAENAGGRSAELLFFPDRGRGGVAWSGEVIWTDAPSAEEVMERYLDHTILEDNDTGP